MSSKSTTGGSKLLRSAGVAIENALSNEEITACLETSGYSRNSLEDGKRVHEAAQAAAAALDSARTALRQAAVKALETGKIAREAFQGRLQVAKISLGKASLASLGITGSGAMPRAPGDFVTKAYMFFDTVGQKPDIQAKLVENGCDITKLQSERMIIVAYDQALQAKGEAENAHQRAGIDSIDAFAVLMDWYLKFRGVAVKALSGKQHLLKRLGIALPAAAPSAKAEGDVALARSPLAAAVAPQILPLAPAAAVETVPQTSICH